jgi:hypothetical protein
VDGLITWGRTVTLGASVLFLDIDTHPQPDPDPQRNYFRTTRVADGMGCGEILAQRDRRFVRGGP